MTVTLKQVPTILAAGVFLLACFTQAAVTEAAVYVVDNGHPKADDKNPGTEAAPWKTIQHAADTVKPGDTVCVMAGTYPERVRFPAGVSGKEGSKITFRALPRHSARMQGFLTHGCDYLRIEGFSMTHPSEIPEGLGLGESRLARTGIQVGSHYVEVVDNVFPDNEFYGIWGSSGGSEKDYQNARHAYVAYNKVIDSGSGIFISGSHWVVEHNEVYKLKLTMKGTDCDYSRAFGHYHKIRYNFFHGSVRADVGQSHMDSLQTYGANDEYGHDILMEHNVFFDFAQGFIGSNPVGGEKWKGWTVRHNLFAGETGVVEINKDRMLGVHGVMLSNMPGSRIENNTFLNLLYFGTFLNVDRGVVNSNLYYNVGSYSYAMKETCTSDRNLIFKARKPGLLDPARNVPHKKDLMDQDPRFVDAGKSNYRLAAGSPAIDSGVGGKDIGALEYPNVYYVDPRHPGASDEFWGYAGAPFRTAARACAVAKAGETIVLRGGVYRETLKPQADGVMIRAAKGEKVLASGADLVTGWKRQGDGWAAPMATKPDKVFLDGKPWDEFTYDAGSKTIRATGFDPRLHVVECVVREHGVDLRGHKDVKLEGVEAVHTTGDAIVR